jgi:hypothetical protein
MIASAINEQAVYDLARNRPSRAVSRLGARPAGRKPSKTHGHTGHSSTSVGSGMACLGAWICRRVYLMLIDAIMP